jgi:hypothetical protein
MMLSSLVAGTLTMAAGTTKPLVLLVRLTLTFLLALAMVKGASWARWVIVVLTAIAGLYGGYSMFSIASPVPIFNLMILGAMCLFYLGLSAFLAFSPSVNAYFRDDASSLFNTSSQQS